LPINQVNPYPKGLTSDNNIQSEQNELSHGTWTFKHPNLHVSFFQKVDPPVNLKDAQIKMHCHVQTVEDIELQLEINKLEIELTEKELEETTDDKMIAYLEDKLAKLEEHRLRLYWGKKHHVNARNAYWYYLVQANEDLNI